MEWRAGILRGTPMVCKKSLVGGRVQGVFYRASTATRARELGVKGYAKNLPDGRVEVLACGDAAAVQALIDWLWKGSTASKVTSVETRDVELASRQLPDAFETF